MVKIYIPFNMIVDTDYGVIRLVEKVQNVEPISKNKLKSFLLKREEIDPIPEYSKLRNLEVSEHTYSLIMNEFYESVLQMSTYTDLLSFILTTHKLGVTNELQITVGCEHETEIDYLCKMVTGVKLNCRLTKDIKLNDFDYIFVKVIDPAYVDYLIDTEKISAKRVYVADYAFNTIYEKEYDQYIMDPFLHMKMEEHGNVMCVVSIYNKKHNGGEKQ